MLHIRYFFLDHLHAFEFKAVKRWINCLFCLQASPSPTALCRSPSCVSLKAKSPPPVTEAKAKKSSKDKGRKKLEKSVPEPAVVAPPTKKKSKSAKAGAGPGATAKPLTRTADHAADNDVGDEDVDDEQAGLNPDFVFDAEPIDTPSWTPHYQLKKGPEV